MTVKNRVKQLFEERERLLQETSDDLLLDKVSSNSKELLTIHVEHVATTDWVVEQITQDIPHALMDAEGERAMFEELRAWAEV